MFNTITWGQYISAIAILLVCYYLFVGAKYFRWEISVLFGIKKIDDGVINIPTVSNFKNDLVTENPENYLPKPAAEIDISPLVLSFSDEVKAYIYEAGGSIQKEELINSLIAIASKYPALKEADCKEELTELVLKEAHKQHPNLLQPGDLNQLWK